MVFGTMKIHKSMHYCCWCVFIIINADVDFHFTELMQLEQGFFPELQPPKATWMPRFGVWLRPGEISSGLRRQTGEITTNEAQQWWGLRRKSGLSIFLGHCWNVGLVISSPEEEKLQLFGFYIRYEGRYADNIKSSWEKQNCSRSTWKGWSDCQECRGLFHHLVLRIRFASCGAERICFRFKSQNRITNVNSKLYDGTYGSTICQNPDVGTLITLSRTFTERWVGSKIACGSDYF